MFEEVKENKNLDFINNLPLTQKLGSSSNGFSKYFAVGLVVVSIIAIIVLGNSAHLFDFSNNNSDNSTMAGSRELSEDIVESSWNEIKYEDIKTKTGNDLIFPKEIVINKETYVLDKAYLSPQVLLTLIYKTTNQSNKLVVQQQVHGYADSSYPPFEEIREAAKIKETVILSNGTSVELSDTNNEIDHIYWQDDNNFYLLTLDYPVPYAEIQKFLENVICHYDLDVDVRNVRQDSTIA